ncbi:MAG: hypothetical protein WC938_01085 [Candidatus Paceibacterota bacterium]|jgi:hypothetical protein
MKNSHALILIVVCIAIAIVGWNGLMKTYVAQSSSDSDNKNWDTSTKEGRINVWNSVGELDGHPKKDKNPFVVPIGILALGVIGICYGAYSLVKNKQSRIVNNS